ncbi:hypothetical protein K502DRAFT_366732 [Neoconidiobolus thromboides FSU 785]|nr:hypothetical protein K502DRAFT_366732 [Neoconidiobolus thromboides FSU 785]
MDNINNYESSNSEKSESVSNSEDEKEHYASSLNKRITNSNKRKLNLEQFKTEEYSLPIYEPQEEFDDSVIKGYSVKLFEKKGDVIKENISTEEGIKKELKSYYEQWLVPSIYSDDLTLDRYDVRNLIDLSQFQFDKQDNSINDQTDEDLDKFRFEFYKLNENDSSEETYPNKRRNTIENKAGAVGIGYEYSTIESKKEDKREEEIDEKQLTIMKKTAAFVIKSNNPLLEIQIMSKQSNNPLFKFLNKRDALNLHYQRLKDALRLGFQDIESEEEK